MTSVLVVEDAAIDQRFAGMLVQREGCEVVYADNGKKAIERIENSRPDIVLTDLQMPEMDGLQLVSHLSSDYPGLPVILMTAHGSEEIAVKALRAGAASYVPKRNLSRDLGPVLRSMLSIVEASQQRDQVRRFMKESHSEYELGNDPGGIPILIGHIQDTLGQLNFGDELALLRISTALTEALTNAIDHGNLELDSALREADDDEYRRLRERRIADPIYRDRRIRIAVSITPDEAAFVIRDDGPGFDPCTLPDPTDPDNLNRSSGRGILLMRTFFDEVRFSSRGNEITLIGRRVQ